MNWGDLSNEVTRAVLEHWRKLGQFRKLHPAIGDGVHQRLQEHPYVFSRTLGKGQGRDSAQPARGGQGYPAVRRLGRWNRVVDFYSGTRGRVVNGSITIITPYTLALLSEPRL
jgi:alpha-amylase